MLVGLLAVAAMMLGLLAPAAGATVANTSVKKTWSNQFGLGCSVAVGDKAYNASPYYAIGEIDVTCPSYDYLHLQTSVSLYYSTDAHPIAHGYEVVSGWTDYYPVSRTQTWTDYACGHGYWETYGFVWVNGHKFGPYYSNVGWYPAC